MRFVTLGILFGLPALATTFLPRPFPETVKDAPVIVRGKVGAKRVDWGKGTDNTRRLYTYYDLIVREVLKGPITGVHLIFREMGGEKDGVGLQVSGTAEFSTGEDVVVMLADQNEEGTYDLRGLMMGKLAVEKDENGQEVLDGPALSPAGQFVHDHDEGGGKLALEELRNLVRSQEGAPVAKPAETQGSSPESKGATPSEFHDARPGAVVVPALQPLPPETPSGVEWYLGSAVAIGLAVWLLARGLRLRK